jgi:two-component system OmpR family response regulator
MMTETTGGRASAPTDDRRVAVVIEDDADIRHLLETVLTQAGFQTISAGNGVDGVEAVRRYQPVVTTLDVNMPGMDGFETARRIRDFSNTYIVMLTALGEEIDAMQGLDSGADDYINKPFRPRELRARIEAMMRRPRTLLIEGRPVGAGSEPILSAVTPAAPPAPVTPSIGFTLPEPVLAPVPSLTYAPATASPALARPAITPPAHTAPMSPAPAVTTAHAAGDGWLEHNGIWLDPGSRVVQLDGVEVELTRTEFDLLAGLMESTRRVRTKADLVLLLRGESYVTSHFVSDADKRAVEVHMANLRKKLGENPVSPQWIETVRGVGYRLTARERA